VRSITIDCTAGVGDGEEAIAAAALASLEVDLEEAQVVLVGDETDITESLKEHAHDAERVRVLHAPDRVDRAGSARAAVASAPRSSISVGLAFTGARPDRAFISAGHPGLIVLEAQRHLDRIPSVQRSALAAVYPTLRHRGATHDPFALLLDIGATVHCNADDLVCFSAMGEAYARKVSVVERPKVGLLSNASSLEATPRRIQEAHTRLRRLAGPLDIEFVGCVRGDQVTLGNADVVVTDGFTGDVVVRTLEGAVATAVELLERAEERFRWRLGVSMLGGPFERLRELTDWENYGGAPLLGFTQPVIVTQSNSHRRAFFNAIRLAAKLDRTGVMQAVAESVSTLRETERGG
jgi:glycerol-3-phosphate acyltransferase PlsX